ncbi:alpha/beta hydrolase fold domain-containing protein [Clostridium sp. MCC353]|uniref:alpha/beta hydrolase n=1 Tax=Clostridium sp. MCC353 TaxID=2592646 RepID=UPI001C010511|nr:alpha/beta hydrolase [Clostridium sp. MCC353]MBT9777538.1 alpha/beta hydrolase fold domain-containing protein [Clostridium sp. MCC353]
MKHYIDPGRKRNSINFVDHIVYSKVKDLDGNDLELDLSILAQSGNIEMQTAGGVMPDKGEIEYHPAIVWVSGGGFRGVDKNQMIGETQFLADAGYTVVSVYYRSSAQGKFPAQVVDVKTAIRFLRAHADLYHIDVNRIGIMGRSAGGYLAAFIALNDGDYENEEWSGYSSGVQAAYDMFGPVDMVKLMEADEQAMSKDPNHRWKTVEDTHAGAFMGGDPATMKERAKEASVNLRITETMCPILIAHGDSDPLVPCSISEEFYDAVKEKGMEDRAELYLLKNGEHGSPEFFQEEMRKIALEFFDKILKK